MRALNYIAAAAFLLTPGFSTGAETLQEFPDLSECPWGKLRAPSKDEPAVGKYWQAPDRCQIIGSIFIQANCGDSGAQFRLAYWYRRGLMDLKQDFTKSYAWYEIASRNGRADAADDRDRLAARIPSTDIETAKNLAKAWAPLDCPGDEWKKSPEGRIRIPQ